MSFETRAAAGRALAPALTKFKTQSPVVLALPRGGVAVAVEIARALEAELDLVLVRKIGVPSQPELAMGAVVDGSSPLIVRNENVISTLGIDAREFRICADAELDEIVRRRARYLGKRPPAAIAGKVAIVVDDGVATGTTVRAALRAVRTSKPALLVFAVPVGPRDTIIALRQEADEVVCLESPASFYAVGLHYDDFHQMTDREVIGLLNEIGSGPDPS